MISPSYAFINIILSFVTLYILIRSRFYSLSFLRQYIVPQQKASISHFLPLRTTTREYVLTPMTTYGKKRKSCMWCHHNYNLISVSWNHLVHDTIPIHSSDCKLRWHSRVYFLFKSNRRVSLLDTSSRRVFITCPAANAHFFRYIYRWTVLVSGFNIV